MGVPFREMHDTRENELAWGGAKSSVKTLYLRG